MSTVNLEELKTASELYAALYDVKVYPIGEGVYATRQRGKNKRLKFDLKTCFEILKWKCLQSKLFVVHTITLRVDHFVDTIKLCKESDSEFEIAVIDIDLSVAIIKVLHQAKGKL